MKKFFVTVLLSIFCVAGYAQTMDKVNVAGSPDGDFVQENNGVKVYGKVLDGKKSGTWTETYANTEVPRFIIQYVDNNKDGLYLEFDKQGAIVKKVEYKNNLMDGTYLKFKNAVLMERIGYKEGKKNGESTLYYDKGTVMETSNFKDGQRDGVTMWYANKDKTQGEMVAMYTYKEGKFEGVQETYYENGAVKTRKMFVNNVQEGPVYEFYEDGSLKTEANFKNGEQKGKTKEYPQGKKFLKN